MEDAARVSDRLVVLDHGGMLMQGIPQEVFSQSSRLIEAGLDVPMVTRLFIELRSRGIDISDSVYTVEQGLAELLRLKEGKNA